MDLKGTFDAVAERYDATRPRYAAVLIDELEHRAGLHECARLLEVAPVTGQANRISGVELGANMARVACEGLKAYRNVEIVNASVEAAQLPRSPSTTRTLRRRGIGSHPRRDCKNRTRSSSRPRAISPLFIGTMLRASKNKKVSLPRRCSQSIWATQDAVTGARTYLPRRSEQLEAKPVDEGLLALVLLVTSPQTMSYSAQDCVNLLRRIRPHWRWTLGG